MPDEQRYLALLLADKMMKYIKSADKSMLDYQPLKPFGKSYPRY